MKKNLYTLVFALCAWGILDAQVPKKLFIEEATQASCGPCAAVNPNFDAMIKTQKDKAVVLKYQVWWPGFDPMFEHNTAEVVARVQQKYTTPGLITGAPGAVLDGVEGINQPFYNLPTVPDHISPEIIDSKIANGSPVSIVIDHSLSDQTNTIEATVTVKNESNSAIAASSHSIFVASVEDEIKFPTPPGSNGETDFNWVFRKFLTAATGDNIADELAPGEEMVFTFSEPIPTYTYDLGEIGIVAWFENNSTGAVIQSEHSEAKPVVGNFPDLSMSYTFADYDGLCDDEMTVNIVVKNEGQLDVDGFDIYEDLGQGNTNTLINENSTLTPGSENTYQLQLPLVFGSYGLSLGLDKRGLVDAYTHNELLNSDIYSVVANDPFAIEINEGFVINQIGQLPANIVLDNRNSVRLFTVNQAISQAVTWPLGGHGNSDGCMRFDLLTWNLGQEASVVFNKVDLSDRMDATLTYSYGYAARGGLSNDRLQVQASSNCGEDWVTLSDKTGADLITGADPGQNFRFYPRPNEWQDETLDMSMFDGEEEVIVRFVGISGGAQALYLDDIKLESELSTSVDNIEEIASLRTYPNPAADEVNIEINLDQELNADVSVYDLAGKKINTLLNGNMSIGTQTVKWYPENNGVYLVKITSNEGVVSQKVTVVK